MTKAEVGKIRNTGKAAALTGKPSSWRQLFRRAPWENAASLMIGAGIFMLMQPFSMSLFTYSFAVILIGTIGFVIASHFPE